MVPVHSATKLPRPRSRKCGSWPMSGATAVTWSTTGSRTVAWIGGHGCTIDQSCTRTQVLLFWLHFCRFFCLKYSGTPTPQLHTPTPMKDYPRSEWVRQGRKWISTSVPGGWESKGGRKSILASCQPATQGHLRTTARRDHQRPA